MFLYSVCLSHASTGADLVRKKLLWSSIIGTLPCFRLFSRLGRNPRLPSPRSNSRATTLASVNNWRSTNTASRRKFRGLFPAAAICCRNRARGRRGRRSRGPKVFANGGHSTGALASPVRPLTPLASTPTRGSLSPTAAASLSSPPTRGRSRALVARRLRAEPSTQLDHARH